MCSTFRYLFVVLYMCSQFYHLCVMNFAANVIQIKQLPGLDLDAGVGGDLRGGHHALVAVQIY